MKCSNCERGIVLNSYPSEYITREMAIDAGDKRLEGQVFSTQEEYEVCSCCNGYWEDCETCDGLTADDRNTFADCVEDALMREHPVDQAQRIEREIDWMLDAEAAHADWLDNERTMREAL